MNRVVVLLLALGLVACSAGGTSHEADETSVSVNCQWKEDRSAGMTLTYLDAPVTVTTPFDLDWVKVRLEATDGSGSVLPRGAQTKRFDQISSVSPRTFEAQFGATLGWPRDVTCRATIADYFRH